MIIIEYKLALHSKSKIDQNYASITSGSCFCSKLSNLKLENFLWSLLITTEGTSPISSSRLSTLSTLILSVSFSSFRILYYLHQIRTVSACFQRSSRMRTPRGQRSWARVVSLAGKRLLRTALNWVENLFQRFDAKLTVGLLGVLFVDWVGNVLGGEQGTCK